MKRRTLFLAVFIVITLGGFALLFFGSSVPDPLYQGKRLSTWLRQGPNSIVLQAASGSTVYTSSSIQVIPGSGPASTMTLQPASPSGNITAGTFTFNLGTIMV